MTIQMKTGDSFRVSLGSNPSIPLRWQVNTTPGLVITRQEYRPGNPLGEMTGMVGGGGTQSWEVRTVQPGIQEFRADQVRLNARAGEPALLQSIRIGIIVQERG